MSLQVTTRADPQARTIISIGDLGLESGEVLPDAQLSYESFGTLSPERDNAILLFHGLTAHSHLTRSATDPSPGWWERVVGSRAGLDTDRWCVIAPDILGGGGCSSGPTSLAPDGREWAARFPAVTIRDQVGAARVLGDALGMRSWAG